MQGYIQDFVLGEVRGRCVGGGSGGGHRRAVVRTVDWRTSNRHIRLRSNYSTCKCFQAHEIVYVTYVERRCRRQIWSQSDTSSSSVRRTTFSLFPLTSSCLNNYFRVYSIIYFLANQLVFLNTVTFVLPINNSWVSGDAIMLKGLGRPVKIMILGYSFLLTDFDSTSAIFKTLYLAPNKN